MVLLAAEAHIKLALGHGECLGICEVVMRGLPLGARRQFDGCFDIRAIRLLRRGDECDALSIDGVLDGTAVRCHCRLLALCLGTYRRDGSDRPLRNVMRSKWMDVS